MLPTPDTSHVPYSRVYEPAEDSFLMIDTLTLPAETAFLQERFGAGAPAPLVVEIGSGSGVVLAFVVAQAAHLFGGAQAGRTSGGGDGIMALAVDVNAFACTATGETVRRAVREVQETQAQAPAQTATDGPTADPGGSTPAAVPAAGTDTGTYLGAVRADLASALRPGQVDVLLFNPPYVPTPTLPQISGDERDNNAAVATKEAAYARDSHLLELAYAGGYDGMETTDRLLAALPALLAPRGCAYILLCAQNRPDEVKERVRGWRAPAASAGEDAPRSWRAETVGSSGRQAGWEKLQIVRIWSE